MLLWSWRISVLLFLRAHSATGDLPIKIYIANCGQNDQIEFAESSIMAADLPYLNSQPFFPTPLHTFLLRTKID